MVSSLATTLYLSTLLSLSMTERLTQSPYTLDTQSSEPDEVDETPFYVPKYPPSPSMMSPSCKVPPAAASDVVDGFNMSSYAYDKAGRLAREVSRVARPPAEELLRVHMYYLLESPTAKAMREYADKVEYAKSNGAEDCLASGEEKAIKDFRKRLAEVVWACESGWKRNSTVIEKTQTLLKTIDDLDRQANETLKGCTKDTLCYYQFSRSSQAANINKQLSELRRNQLIDLKVIADQDHVTSMYSLYKCNADNSDSLRKDIYTASAKLNVCISNAGLITNF